MDETVKSLREDVASLKNTLQEIQKKHNIPDDVFKNLEQLSSQIPLEFLKKTVKNAKKSVSKQAYHPALRQFAMTLHLYSPKSYR